MDNHLTLKMLLGTLFDNNTLKNWTIYEEYKSKNVVMKIRFTNDQSMDNMDNITYKRKSEKQAHVVVCLKKQGILRNLRNLDIIWRLQKFQEITIHFQIVNQPQWILFWNLVK